MPQDVGPLAIIDDCHMQMICYDEEFENLGPHIPSDISMDSTQLYLSSIKAREACYTENYLANIQSMMTPDYHSQLCCVRSVEEVV